MQSITESTSDRVREAINVSNGDRGTAPDYPSVESFVSTDSAHKVVNHALRVWSRYAHGPSSSIRSSASSPTIWESRLCKGQPKSCTYRSL